MKSVLWRLVSSLCLTVLVASVMSFPGQAKERKQRRSMARDWTYGRIVAAGYGSQDPVVQKDWRTLRRHQQIESARVAPPEPDAGWAPWTRQGGLRRGTAGQSTGNVFLDWSLNTGGTGSVIGYPAKFNFDIAEANCSDVIYYTVNHTGTATRPNVIAITNPYAGCPGNPANLTPTVKWALRLPTGTGTSPTLSLDGKILYVFESVSNAPVLHAILVDNIKQNTGTYNFNAGTWSGVHTLQAPTGLSTSEQLFQLTFNGTDNNLSSPYLDYDNNVIYFGDGDGRVHKIQNATSPNAAEAPGWPVSCNAGAFQSPMAYDGQVIVGSTDGYLYRINTNQLNPTCIRSARFGSGSGAQGGLTTPTIDVTNSKVIVTVGQTNSGNQKAIGVFNLHFTSGQGPVDWASMGTSDGIASQFPALDNDFWTTNDGNIYAVGNGGRTATLLIRFPYNGSQILSAAGYATLHHTGRDSSVNSTPVVEFLTAAGVSNPDFIYVGGNGSGYNYMNRISSKFNGTANNPVSMAGFFGTAGGITSGISVDTRTTATTGTTATANIYFGTASSGILCLGNSTIVQLAQQF